MTDRCTLRILDQVNVKLDNLNPHVRRKIVDALKFPVPYARHMPAFKLGRWDGKVSFATAGGGTYLNLLDRVLPFVLEAGYEIEIDDQRPAYDFKWPEVDEMFMSDQVWPEGHPLAGEPILLRDYQVEAINRFLDNPQSIQQISTGAGKTILTATLSKICEPYGRTIVIVPNKSLVIQTEEDYIAAGLDVGVFFGDRKEWNKTHTIATWQSLATLGRRARQGETTVTLDDLLKGIVAVICDETHSAKANELKELLSGALAFAPIRWGLTGTIPKEDYEYLALLSTIGPVVGEIKASELQEKGVLANLHIDILQLKDGVEYKNYMDELAFLISDKRRLEWIAGKINRVATQGNTLVLIDRIEAGETLQQMIPGSSFVNGSTKASKRREEYKEVQEADRKVIIATYGVAAVGINIPRIFNLVLIEPGKSFVRVIQSIGRGIRKAEDKDFVQIYDVTSSCKFSARHLTKRKAYYKEANYPFTLTKVEYF